MKRSNSLMLSLLITLMSIGAVQAQSATTHASWATRVKDGPMKNLYQVSNILYRSEQPDSMDFVYLSKHGIRSSLCLRTRHSDKKLIGNTPVRPYHIEMDVSHFTDEEIVQALKIIEHAPHPIVIHCHHGADRTGVVAAMYRIIFQGWTKEEALDELLHGGFGFHEKYTNIPVYIKQADINKIRKEVL